MGHIEPLRAQLTRSSSFETTYSADGNGRVSGHTQNRAVGFTDGVLGLQEVIDVGPFGCDEN